MDLGFREKCRIPSDSDADLESLTSLPKIDPWCTDAQFKKLNGSPVKNGRVQTTQTEWTQKQSYKTHPLLLETLATVMFVYFW